MPICREGMEYLRTCRPDCTVVDVIFLAYLTDGVAVFGFEAVEFGDGFFRFLLDFLSCGQELFQFISLDSGETCS